MTESERRAAEMRSIMKTVAPKKEEKPKKEEPKEEEKAEKEEPKKATKKEKK